MLQFFFLSTLIFHAQTADYDMFKLQAVSESLILSFQIFSMICVTTLPSPLQVKWPLNFPFNFFPPIFTGEVVAEFSLQDGGRVQVQAASSNPHGIKIQHFLRQGRA